jgi:hypothetical protein
MNPSGEKPELLESREETGGAAGLGTVNKLAGGKERSEEALEDIVTICTRKGERG